MDRSLAKDTSPQIKSALTFEHLLTVAFGVVVRWEDKNVIGI